MAPVNMFNTNLFLSLAFISIKLEGDPVSLTRFISTRLAIKRLSEIRLPVQAMIILRAVVCRALAHHRA